MDIDLNKLTEAQLDKLRIDVQAEIEMRIKGPKIRVWYAELNGGRQYYKSFKSAIKELIDDAENTTEDEDVYLRFDNQNIPQKDYDLKPDSWYVD